MKVFVNITSWMDIGSAGAEHFYAKASLFDSDENIYVFAAKGFLNSKKEVGEDVELVRPIDAKEAKYLNKKTKCNSYREGMTTSRFRTIDEIKESAKLEFPEYDIAFFRNYELEYPDINIFQRNPDPIVETDMKIQIHNFKGFSPNFKNLTEGSIHTVIKTPPRYKDKVLQEGYWVMGVNEPALVLRNEYSVVK